MNTSSQPARRWQELMPMEVVRNARGLEVRRAVIFYAGHRMVVTAFEYKSETPPPADAPSAKSFTLVVDGPATAELTPVWTPDGGMDWLIAQARNAGTLDAACLAAEEVTLVA